VMSRTTVASNVELLLRWIPASAGMTMCAVLASCRHAGLDKRVPDCDPGSTGMTVCAVLPSFRPACRIRDADRRRPESRG